MAPQLISYADSAPQFGGADRGGKTLMKEVTGLLSNPVNYCVIPRERNKTPSFADVYELRV